ncbi:hypothetical protein C5E02_12665 [Rathayibacter rathayi]|nr:hypothetical protein C5C11_12700 [Rathayibacter rathayi]PPG37289.1 hypothetical protein C5C20_14120 [Rathayibacter rathayi]PPI59012.1 hypothetical protein C5E02_12665 [Rathayibacter rathayi]
MRLQAVPLYEAFVNASVGKLDAAAAGVAIETATTGTVQAAPFTMVRRWTPSSEGTVQSEEATMTSRVFFGM